jgi:hypothetical protein
MKMLLLERIRVFEHDSDLRCVYKIAAARCMTIL